MDKRYTQDVRGIDVSHWQGTVHWAQVKQTGVTFAFVKATEGEQYVDSSYRINFSGTCSAGILRGAYHFARPGAGLAARQAEHFLQTVGRESYSGELPPALDLEDAGGLSAGELVKWTNEWLTAIEKVLKRSPILYVSAAFAQKHLIQKIATPWLWLADWTELPSSRLGQWNQWTFWQYSNQGKVKGITGNVDEDIFSGTLADFKRWLAAAHGDGARRTAPDSAAVSGARPELKKGAKGTDVMNLQLLLYRAGEHPGPVDGVFGNVTLQAVVDFQKKAKLALDGIVGPETWGRLLLSPTDCRPELFRKVTGQQVKDAQYLLKYWGMSAGTADGIFGSRTDTAVRNFQEKVRISVDGVIGPETWKRLLGSQQ